MKIHTLCLQLYALVFADIVDSIEKENIILKKKNLELQEQIEILEKAIKTVSEEKQRSKHEEEEKGIK